MTDKPKQTFSVKFSSQFEKNKCNLWQLLSEKWYYKKIISNHKNSTTQLWKTFGKILNQNKVKHKSIRSLLINDNKVTEPQVIADSFNDFFCNPHYIIIEITIYWSRI